MRRTRHVLTKAHRWGSFTLGLLLLVVVISGVVLVLDPEIEQVTHPSLYDTAPGPTKLAPGDALAVVHEELPEFDTTGTFVYDNRGAWEVHSPATGEIARVDDTDGRLLGTIDREHGLMGFVANLHECGFTCEEMSGYVGFLAKPAQVRGLDLTLGNEGNWGGFILAVSAILLLILVLTGIVLWWPGRGRVKRGLKVRRGRGRYKLHYDLHKVVGFLALPALAIWALTGINFELPKQTEGAFYAVTPGSAPPESIYEFESKPGSGPGVTMSEAIEEARTAVPSDSTLISVTNPERGEKTSYYELWFAHGVDTWAYGDYPGNYGVYVDRYSGQAQRYFPNPGNDTVTNNFMQNWAGAIHMGTLVGWIPRLGWIAFGLTPLLLAITGTATWVMRRRMGRRKKGGRGGGGAVAVPAGAEA
ncbi:MAG TPA: PepSY-associated TM helix domain-containing protein [Solirubrobacterales bacterium]|nr:PepSY-associated TM helix domain-containing protein [Solirubrobacterales bacterium]